MVTFRVKLLFMAVCLLSLSTCLVGCGDKLSGPATEPVSGVVTLDGTPVPQANVVFLPDAKNGKPASGVTDENGRYELTTFNPKDGAMAGSYKVMITKAKAENTSDVDLSGLSEEEALEKAAEEYYSSDAYKKQGSRQADQVVNLIPANYGNVVQSGLTASVAKGKNTFDFALTGK